MEDRPQEAGDRPQESVLPPEEPVEVEVSEPEKWYKGPLKWIIGAFLILIIVLWVVPHYSVKLDPGPTMMPSVEEVFSFSGNLSEIKYSLNADRAVLINPSDLTVKRTANKIASLSCESAEKICQAKAEYYFVRDSFDYISDPINIEYVERFEDFILNGGGDCESGTIVLANLMEAIGIDAQFVMVPGHAFLRIWLPDAAQRYKINDWIYLDWTCSTCEFGQLPLKYIDVEKTVLEV
ncbi:MAG: transglutaminase domain-containing protein [Nanoarchaeota archaeon]|nr:transglutaminase domain-containing protein [Nanoarchaeota archaeon]